MARISPKCGVNDPSKGDMDEGGGKAARCGGDNGSSSTAVHVMARFAVRQLVWTALCLLMVPDCANGADGANGVDGVDGADGAGGVDGSGSAAARVRISM